MRRNPERLAWSILIIALLICVTLSVSIPLAIRGFINDTADVSAIKLEVQQGTVLVYRPGTAEPIGVTTQLDNLPEGSSIQADENTQALLTIQSPTDGSTLLIVQIYGNTKLSIEQSRSPRFSQSTLPQRETLRLDSGRVRLSVTHGPDRLTEVNIISPQASTALKEGSCSLEVANEELQVTVRDGVAEVSAQSSTLTLNSLQRTRVVQGHSPDGILSPERNLIVDGNFRQTLNDNWVTTNDLQQSTESPGSVEVLVTGGRRSAVFNRQGVYHAETDLRQVINKDVRDFRSLKLHFVVEVFAQDVPVCGQAGSECPLMLRLEYKDANGTDRSYIQGFYYLTDSNNVNPTYCTSCGSRIDHIRVPRNFPYTYELGDLMKLLQPTQITAITFYASGHSYRSAVSEVELLGEQ
jgi:hypothetical protein